MSRKHEGLLWKKWRRLAADRTVLIESREGVSWTVAGLSRHAEGFAHLLGGFHPGDKIAYRLPNGAEWMAFFLALQRAGLAAVPLDAATPDAGCFEIAGRMGARAVYLHGELHALKEARRSSGVCCVKITSGSDGLPKAIPCRAEHLLADGRQVVATMKIRPNDRNLAAIPLGHSYGLGNLVMPLILQGTAMVTCAEYVPRQLLEWSGRYGVSVMPLVPALFRVLAALPGGPALKTIRTAISAGAPLNTEIARAFYGRFGVKIHNFYGSSETGGICYDRTGSTSLAGRSVGKPLVGVTIALAGGRPTVKSRAVATRSGSWRLGDAAEWNSRGELVLLGRAGQGANIGGKKVHPLEIERALRALPGVSDASVWLTHREGRDVLAAAVETKHSRSDLEKELARRLPAWKHPKYFWVTRELPRNERGKLDLAALRRHFPSNRG